MITRGYLNENELANYIGTSEISGDKTKAIAKAEAILDGYVGIQAKFFRGELTGVASSGGNDELTLAPEHRSGRHINYYKGLVLQIVDGAQAGLATLITGSTADGVLSFASLPDNAEVDNTSIYRIVQLGKFPRHRDIQEFKVSGETRITKIVPEALKEAVALQVEYMISMGDDFFSGDDSRVVSENLLSYSYQKKSGDADSGSMIGPKVKVALQGQGIVNRRGGRIIL